MTKSAIYLRILLSLFIVFIFVSFLPGTTDAQAMRDEQRPTIPGNLAAFSITETSLDLSWSTSQDNVGVVSYDIYQDLRLVASVPTAQASIKDLKPGTVHSFFIKARDAVGNNSLASAIIRVKTVLIDNQAPTTPADPSACAITSSSLDLSWSASTDNIKVSTYLVYQDSVCVGTTTEPAYQVTGLNASTPYSFRIMAKDAAGNLSPSSAELSQTTLPEPEKIIVGYYASWAAYSGYTPASISVSQVTHINYAFADIGDDLKIVMGDPAVDPANFMALKALKKKNPALKTLISIGGWTWSGKFSDVALTDESRTIFADSVVAFIKQYGFDGVDIDWEYPRGGGLSTNISRFSDKGNFTALMAKLREKLDAQGDLDGAHYLLSFAGGSNPTYTNNTELKKLAKYVDYAAIMTYDIHGTADRYTDFNAPLYLPRESSPQTELSVNAAVKTWLAKGFPSSKMVMGVPFYGYIYTDAKDVRDGLFQRFADCSSIPYDEIKSKYSNDSTYVRRYHEDARVPWLFDGTTFISYDDPESIAEKSAYIKSNRILGAAVWDLSQDSHDELLDTLYGNLK